MDHLPSRHPRSRTAIISTGRTILLGLTLIGAVVAVAAAPYLGTAPSGARAGLDTAIATELPDLAEMVAASVPTAVPTPVPTPEPTAVPTPVPTVKATAIATPAPKTTAVATPAPKTTVVATSTISPASDRERLWNDHCMAYERTTKINTACVYGDKSSNVVIALVGDSHAAHLFPAVERIALAHHWKVVVMVKVSCTFSDMRIRNLSLGREYYECATWNKNVLARLAVLKPTLTLVASSRNAMHPVRSIDNTTTAKGRAVGREIAKIPGSVSLIVDSPYRGSYTRSIPRSVALSNSLGAIEKIASAYSGDPRIDLTSATCSSWPCPVVVKGITKFRDSAHFTATFSRTILGTPGGVLDRALLARLP